MKGLPCRFLPCRGGEGGESARLGEACQSANFDSGVGGGLLRRLGDVAVEQTFYTFYTSTRLKQERVCRSFLPCRGGEGGESARLGEVLQSSNLGYGVGLLRRHGDVAGAQTFYTFSPSTRLNKWGEVLPCRGGEGGESVRRSEMLQSSNLETGDGVVLLRRMGDVAWSQTFYTFSTSTRLNKRR